MGRRLAPVSLAAGLACALSWAAPADQGLRPANPLAGPTLFAEGIVSTGAFESHPAFTPDGRTLFFVRSTPQFTDWKIYVTRQGADGWSRPELAPFSGKYRDADPFVTSDGKSLYFISDRPVGGSPKQDMDIWVMERTKSGDWGEPRNLGAPVNSKGNEWLPRLAKSGTLYFGSDRPGGLGATDLYRSRSAGGKFLEPRNLGPAVNSAADEYEPCIAADESFLVFMASGRPDTQGDGDLYISERKDDSWTPARRLGPAINGPGLDIAPWVSFDGTRFFFSSARRAPDLPPGPRPDRPGNGLGDIYELPLDVLRAPADAPATAAPGTILDGVPGTPDPKARYLIYLHGRIVEEQGRRPTHPTYGAYEYDQILKSLTGRGATVISEQRPAQTDVDRFAAHVVDQVRTLLAAGVPPEQVTVAGFSKGGGIAIRTSAFLKNPRVNFVFLAACGDGGFDSADLAVQGRIVSIYEANDEIGRSCKALFAKPGTTGERSEVEVHVGDHHGTFFRVHEEWLDPLLRWVETAPVPAGK